MAIFTRFGENVKITEARIVPVWLAHYPGKIDKTYHKPKLKKTPSHIETYVDMLVRLESSEDGRRLLDGKFIPLAYLKADDGWKELCDAFWATDPSLAPAYNRWAEGGDQSFEPIDDNEVA